MVTMMQVIEQAANLVSVQLSIENSARLKVVVVGALSSTMPRQASWDVAYT
jgi:hypothetical protein